MRNFFAMLYEIEGFIYDQNFVLLFRELYRGNGYILLGLSMVFVPFLLLMLFYWDSRLPWGNPYRKKFSWVIWLVLSAVVVGGVSYAILYPVFFNSSDPALIQAMNDPTTQYDVFAKKLIVRLPVLNGTYSLVTGFLWSLLLKQKSVLHIHIPF